MLGKPSNDQPNQLVHQVVDACQNIVKKAVAQPKTAIHLAHALAGSLSTLQLVQAEVAKGEAGAVTIVKHAEELTRGALTDVLKHASDPFRAGDILRTTSGIVPSLTATTALTPASGGGDGRNLPTFAQTSQAYIEMRIARDGADHPDIAILQLRRHTTVQHLLVEAIQIVLNREDEMPAPTMRTKV